LDLIVSLVLDGLVGGLAVRRLVLGLVLRFVLRLVLLGFVLFAFVLGLVSGLVFGLVSGLVSGLAVLNRLVVIAFVGRFVVVGLSLTFVLDISDVARVAVDVVVDDLLAAVGEDNPVVAGGLVTFTAFVLTEVVVVIILHGPVELVVSGSLYKWIIFLVKDFIPYSDNAE